MALLQNRYIESMRPWRVIGRAPNTVVGISGYYDLNVNFRNRQLGTDNKDFQPNWIMPIKAGRMSSHNDSPVVINGTAIAWMGLPVEATGSFTIDGTSENEQLIASGAGSTTFEILGNTPFATALINGSGTGDISITTTGGAMTGKGFIDGSSTFNITGSLNLSAIGLLSGSNADTSTLTAQSISDAIWGNVIESGLSATQVMKLILAVQTGQSDIVTAGSTKTVKFKSADGSKDRITATMNGANRTSVVKDAT